MGPSTAAQPGHRAREIEALGYGTLWVGGSPSGDLTVVEQLLDATSTLTLVTSIVNIWSADAAVVAASYARLEGAHPGRFLVCVGTGHREQVGAEYEQPYAALVRDLDLARHTRSLVRAGLLLATTSGCGCVPVRVGLACISDAQIDPDVDTISSHHSSTPSIATRFTLSSTDIVTRSTPRTRIGRHSQYPPIASAYHRVSVGRFTGNDEGMTFPELTRRAERSDLIPIDHATDSPIAAEDSIRAAA